jgi:hypothetical protein
MLADLEYLLVPHRYLIYERQDGTVVSVLKGGEVISYLCTSTPSMRNRYSRVWVMSPRPTESTSRSAVREYFGVKLNAIDSGPTPQHHRKFAPGHVPVLA